MTEHDAFLTAARQRFPTPAGRYVLDHGQWFNPQPRPKGVRKQAEKRCYLNATRIILDRRDLLYVEGFTARRGSDFVVQHAWAADLAGNVIDPTYNNPEAHIYFGVAFDATSYCRALLDDAGSVTGLFHNGEVPRSLAVR